MPRLPFVIAGALVLAAALHFGPGPSAAETARVIPPPAQDDPAGPETTATVVLAGGCFWGVQGVFQHVEGVLNAVSGYAGDDRKTADYETVGTGRTRHAESVRVDYDPRQISFGKILQIFFSVAHDPTQLDQQGPDIGPQYRSAIFPLNEEQARVAAAYIAQLDQTKVYGAKIATRIEPGKEFFPAEDYHQDFMTRNPAHPYIMFNDLPKLASLKKLFAERYRDKPVLVAQAGKTG